MNDTIINIRTDKEIKEKAARVFDDIGLNTSIAVNLFLKQSIIKHKLPFDVDADVKINNIKNTYPKNYFSIFGSGKDLDIEEPEDLDISLDGEVNL